MKNCIARRIIARDLMMQVMEPVQCSQCEYDLSGLPGSGQCPECGQRYWVSRGQGIRKTLTPELRGTMMLRKLRTLALLVTGLIIIAIGAILHYASQKQNALITGLAVGGLVLLLAAISYGLQRED